MSSEMLSEIRRGLGGLVGIRYEAGNPLPTANLQFDQVTMKHRLTPITW